MASISLPHSWRFILTDLSGGVLGEVTNAHNRTVNLPLNQVPTAGFTIPNNHYLAPYLLNYQWDGLLKCYRDNVLRFCGPIVGSNEAFDDVGNQSVAVNAAGALWRLSYRLLGTTPTGWALGTTGTTYDLAYIAQQMLAAGNVAGYTGISSGTQGTTTQGSAGTFWFQDVLTSLANLSTGYNSFDFEVAPTEPTNVGQAWPQIGLLNTVPLLGSVKPNAIFEYGTTKANIANYTRQIDRSQIATKGYMEQPAVADYSGVLTYTDTASETVRGRFEALIDNGGVQYDTLRNALLQENITVRKVARQVVNFVPVMNAVPSPLDDYIVGDQVRARINVYGVNIMDAIMRVWGINFTIDDQNNESVALQLIQP